MQTVCVYYATEIINVSLRCGKGRGCWGPGDGGFPHTHAWLFQHARECLRKHVPKIVRAFLVASSEMESSKIAYVMVFALRMLVVTAGFTLRIAARAAADAQVPATARKRRHWHAQHQYVSSTGLARLSCVPHVPVTSGLRSRHQRRGAGAPSCVSVVRLVCGEGAGQVRAANHRGQHRTDV